MHTHIHACTHAQSKCVLHKQYALLYRLFPHLWPQCTEVRYYNLGMSLVSKSLLPLCGKVHRCCLLLEHLCKQGAVTIDEEDPILLVLGKSTPFNQLKLVRCCPSFEGVGGNSKGQAIPGMVLPTIIVGKVEYQGLGDTLAIIVDVHHWATKLVTLW